MLHLERGVRFGSKITELQREQNGKVNVHIIKFEDNLEVTTEKEKRTRKNPYFIDNQTTCSYSVNYKGTGGS